MPPLCHRLRRLAADVGRDLTDEVPDLGRRGPNGDHDMLGSNAQDTLGPIPDGRPTRIMVTLPSEAADDPSLVDRRGAPTRAEITVAGPLAEHRTERPAEAMPADA